VRHLWSGLGNFNGVVAADLAASGFTGPADMPARVFGETLGTAFDRDSVGRDLGRHFLMLGNYFKTYACCRHAHASVDAMRAILDREPVEVAAIAAIRVGTYGRRPRWVRNSQSPTFYPPISGADISSTSPSNARP